MLSSLLRLMHGNGNRDIEYNFLILKGLLDNADIKKSLAKMQEILFSTFQRGFDQRL